MALAGGSFQGFRDVASLFAEVGTHSRVALRLEVAFDYWESDGESDAWGVFRVREGFTSDGADLVPELRGRTGVLHLEGNAPPAESLARIRRARLDVSCLDLIESSKATARATA